MPARVSSSRTRSRLDTRRVRKQEFPMARLSQHDRAIYRSGVVLLIVMAMLALFAVIGLSFVFYAESESDASRFRRQAEAGDGYDILPEKLLAYALGQLIFDTDNPNSKMR